MWWKHLYVTFQVDRTLRPQGKISVVIDQILTHQTLKGVVKSDTSYTVYILCGGYQVQELLWYWIFHLSDTRNRSNVTKIWQPDFLPNLKHQLMTCVSHCALVNGHAVNTVNVLAYKLVTSAVVWPINWWEINERSTQRNLETQAMEDVKI